MFRRRKSFEGKFPFDWLNLIGVLAIPFVVTFLGLYATQQITQQQAQLSNAANKQQQQIDLQVAVDQQREATLNTYLDDISDLLLNHNLSKSKPGDVVSEIARERTLTVLRRLDANRNRIVLQFLRDANLLSEKNAVIGKPTDNSPVPLIIDLSGGDLSTDDLSGANLFSVDLSVANLSDANLSDANLNAANLDSANLSDAHLHNVILRVADLRFADLSHADLTGADLRFADLSHADLQGAKVTQVQLNQVRLLQDTIMPNGSKHP